MDLLFQATRIQINNWGTPGFWDSCSCSSSRSASPLSWPPHPPTPPCRRTWWWWPPPCSPAPWGSPGGQKIIQGRWWTWQGRFEVSGVSCICSNASHWTFLQPVFNLSVKTSCSGLTHVGWTFSFVHSFLLQVQLSRFTAILVPHGIVCSYDWGSKKSNQFCFLFTNSCLAGSLHLSEKTGSPTVSSDALSKNRNRCWFSNHRRCLAPTPSFYSHLPWNFHESLSRSYWIWWYHGRRSSSSPYTCFLLYPCYRGGAQSMFLSLSPTSSFQLQAVPGLSFHSPIVSTINLLWRFSDRWVLAQQDG